MADVLKLTSVPTNVGTSANANLWSAIDVVDYDYIDLQVELVSWSGGTPSVSVEIVTGFQREIYFGWHLIRTVTLTSTNPTALVQIDSSVLLTYLSWQASATGSTNNWITVTGMGRAAEEA